MTKQKSFKRRVRARMEKTGESYTGARDQLLAKSGRRNVAADEPASDPPTPIAGQRGKSDEAVREGTGRGWDEWFAILDEWGATDRRHPEIAAWLREEHGVTGWWAQTVTVGYEQARGMRAPGERSGGGFAGGASKTVNVPVERLFEAFADDRERSRWLPDAPISLRGATPGKSVRFDWGDGSTRVTVGFDAKGESKAQVGLQHERLPDAGEAERMKAFWRERLAAMKRVLEE